jgi:non-specific serine/threonine protein kinase
VRQLERWLTYARAQLSPQDADTAWKAGAQLTPSEAAAEGLALELRNTPEHVRPSQLTRREREVAMLVASGAGTRDVADELVISPNTARLHVEHILSKLGLHSRAQLTAWVLEQDHHGPPDTVDQGVGAPDSLSSVEH